MSKARAHEQVVAMAVLALVVACKSGGGSGSDKPGAPPATAPAAAPAPAPVTAPAPAAAGRPALLDAAAHETAPSVFKVRVETTKGAFTLEVHRDFAPLGADRFYHLVRAGYFEDVAFFRCIKGFMVQFGIHGDPQVSTAWRNAHILDDPSRVQSNSRGMLTFATAGPNTRTTQLFINYRDNANLDGMGFTPIGRVIDGMDVVDALEGKYGEGAPGGRGPNQGRLQAEGNAYLKAEFSDLDYIKKATIL
jgi:peptidyl-prolyl cis-trans isomerase A (cyclophilin A)